MVIYVIYMILGGNAISFRLNRDYGDLCDWYDFELKCKLFREGLHRLAVILRPFRA